MYIGENEKGRVEQTCCKSHYFNSEFIRRMGGVKACKVKPVVTKRARVGCQKSNFIFVGLTTLKVDCVWGEEVDTPHRTQGYRGG